MSDNTKEEIHSPQEKFRLFKRVEDKDFIPWYYCVLIFIVFFIILFIITTISEGEKSLKSLDFTQPYIDAMGKKRYKLKDGTTPDFEFGAYFTIFTSMSIALITYISNYMLPFRKFLGKVLWKIIDSI
jgi:hypothetical protein